MRKILSAFIILCMLIGNVPCITTAQTTETAKQTPAYACSYEELPYDIETCELKEVEPTLTTDIPEKDPSRDEIGHYTFWSTHQYDPSIPFNQNDVDTMRRFFEIEVDGKTNGYRNNGTYYNKDDVLTWKGPWWNTRMINGVKTYVITALALATNWFYDGFPDIDTYDLRGAADFSGMEYVGAIYMNDTGRYDSIKVDDCPGLLILRADNNIVYGDITYNNCPDMTELYLRNLGLDSINLEIVPKLTKLRCDENNLTQLDLQYITDLYSLHCGNNNLTELDLQYTPNLQELNCNDNSLGFLDLTDFNVLYYVDCSNCNLYELHLPLHDQNFYMSLCVVCANNYLTEIDTSGVQNLGALNCMDNYITELDFKDNTLLAGLHCSRNPIKKIDASELLGIRIIRCEDMGLEELIMPNRATSLSQLYCNGNNLTHLDLSYAPVLDFLICDNNKLTEINLSSQTACYEFDEELWKPMTCFSCAGNPIERIVNLPFISDDATASDWENHYVTLDRSGAGFVNVSYNLVINENPGGELFLYPMYAVPFPTDNFMGWYDGDTLITKEVTLDLGFDSPEHITAKFSGEEYTYNSPDNTLAPHAARVMYENPSDVSLYDAHDAEKLRTFLETEDGSGVKNGTKLNAKYSPDDISTWDFSCWKEVNGKLHLRLLIMDSRMDRDGTMHESVPLAGKLDLSGCDELVFITSPECKITEADFSGCKKLITLSLYGNTALTKLNLDGCESLIIASLHDCGLTNFEFSDTMQYVNLRNNKLSKLSCAAPERLFKLDVSHNELMELSFENEKNTLYILLCSYNKLTELNADTCVKLEYLDCSHNMLKKLVTDGEKYQCNPIAIDCSYNELTDVDFLASWLWVLHIDHNKIVRDVLGDMPNIMELTVEYNEIKKLDLSNSIYLCVLECSHCKVKEIDFGKYNQIVVLHCSDNELDELTIPETSMYLNRLSDLDCGNNKLTEIDLIHAGANMYSLKLSGNPLTKIKNAPVRHDLCMPFVDIYQPNIHVNILAQGNGTLDYDLDTITAIGDDFVGFYKDYTKLTAEKTLPTDDLESCTIIAQFGALSIGDCNMDGKVNTGDAVVVLKHSAEMMQLTDEQKALADCNRDGNVNTGDAVLILKYAAGMITGF